MELCAALVVSGDQADGGGLNPCSHTKAPGHEGIIDLNLAPRGRPKPAQCIALGQDEPKRLSPEGAVQEAGGG